MKRTKVYLVATNADYTVYVNALDEEEAIRKANRYYRKKYGEERNDFEAYDLKMEVWKYGGVREW